ncbi:hypothetical protein ACWEQ2_12390 [Streptomyces sp. NPDC004096]|uniref:hypothetical protein n=1 Tax=unclassified Streptomyces TaxID=2593676 RepID=UPI0033B815B3
MRGSDRARAGRASTRAEAVRAPRTPVRAVTTVVLGPAASTASALDRADRAPLRHAARRGGAPRRLGTGGRWNAGPPVRLGGPPERGVSDDAIGISP